MKVVVAAGGRFHAFALAAQLAKRNSLQAFFTFSDTRQDAVYLPAQTVRHVRTCGLLEQFFSRCGVRRFIDKSLCNSLLDNMFDRQVARNLTTIEPFDLFVGWAHYVGGSIPAARAKGALVVLESGSSHVLAQQDILRRAYRRWGISYEPIAPDIAAKICTEYEAADYIMTLSGASYRSFLEYGVPAGKLLRSTCGVDVPFFSAARQNAPMRRFTGLRVLFVGLINVRKGIGELLQAWSMQPAPGAMLQLVGAVQRDGDALLNRFGSLPGLRILGPVDRLRLRELYAHADVVVLPSIEDGFGMVIGEAMASGCAVICSESAGGSQLVQHGKTGFVVPTQDHVALADILAWCATHRDQVAQMGLLGSQAIVDCTWDAYGQNVYDQYTTLLKQGARHA